MRPYAIDRSVYLICVLQIKLLHSKHLNMYMIIYVIYVCILVVGMYVYIVYYIRMIRMMYTYVES